MIVKPCTVPLSIQKLQALLRRLPSQHEKIPRIKQELSRKLAGYKGESSLSFVLGFLDEKKYFIFHDVRLQDGPRFFQIDVLLLTRSCIIFLEVKNIAGTLYFDPVFNQLIRTKDGTETAFPDPLLQIKRQEQQLTNWLIRYKLPSLPICPLVVISNPQTIIRTSPDNKKLHHTVIHRNALPTVLQQLDFLSPKISEKELQKVIRLLKKYHIDAEFSPIAHYGIQKEELIKGVFCQTCHHTAMRRTHGAWLCLQCGCKQKKAHIKALRDYALLVNERITNSELRQFLSLNSTSAATRLLQELNLPYNGAKKNRTYDLSSLSPNFHHFPLY